MLGTLRFAQPTQCYFNQLLMPNKYKILIMF